MSIFKKIGLAGMFIASVLAAAVSTQKSRPNKAELAPNAQLEIDAVELVQDLNEHLLKPYEINKDE